MSGAEHQQHERAVHAYDRHVKQQERSFQAMYNQGFSLRDLIPESIRKLFTGRDDRQK